jgi:hypothetical protein
MADSLGAAGVVIKGKKATLALVSAIVPAYNAEATIAQAIESALALKSIEMRSRNRGGGRWLR